MTLAELCLSVSHKTALSDAAASSDLTFLYAVANKAVQKVLLDTHVYVVKDTLALVAGTSEYELDTGYLAIIEYTNQTDNRNTFAVVGTHEVLTRRLSGTQGAARRFSLLGNNLLFVNPTPEANATVDFYGVPIPTAMSSGSHDPSATTYGGIPAWGHQAIEWWMCVEASQKNKDMEGIQYYSQMYEREVSLIRKRARGRSGRYLPGFAVGYPDLPNIPPPRNDQDW